MPISYNTGAIRLTPRGRLRSPSIQAPTRDPSNDDLARKYQCATCKVTYEVPRGHQAQCPACKAHVEVEQLRQALLEARNKLELQTNELNRLRPQVDLVTAMRHALELTGPEDRMFLKSVAYRHRAGDTVSLQVTTTQKRGRRDSVKRVPTGFLAVYRTGRESHQCTSIGGLALARYTHEGLTTAGPITTMQNLMRALSEYLTPTGP
jgi:hypothetical protein